MDKYCLLLAEKYRISEEKDSQNIDTDRIVAYINQQYESIKQKDELEKKEYGKKEQEWNEKKAVLHAEIQVQMKYKEVTIKELEAFKKERREVITKQFSSNASASKEVGTCFMKSS